MDQLLKLTEFPNDVFVYLLLDISVAIGLLLLLRYLAGILGKRQVREELSKDDNFAYGISFAGRILSLIVVLASLAGRQVDTSYMQTVVSMLVFGLVGVLLIKVGRHAHDKWVLHLVDKDALIRDKNVSIGVIDASSSVASAIIISAIMTWADGADLNTLVAVISGFFVVQGIMLVVTRIFERQFARINQNNSFQEVLVKGQLAVSIQHSGYLLGAAIAVSSAGAVLQYSPEAYVSNVTGWIIMGGALALLLLVLVEGAKRVLLRGIEYDIEINHQHNVGVASIEAVLAIGLAMLVAGLLNSPVFIG